jgi:hypothetical protein
MASPCVQCSRVYLHEPVFVRSILFAVTLAIPHRACPYAYLGMKSYIDSSGNTSYYQDLKHTPASCGPATACPAAISSITDTVLSAMKTGFAVSV